MTHPVDKHVGQRVRVRRKLMGLTQQELANSIGIKFQQVQKYETGTNRVSSSKLWDISRTLQVPIEYFFEDYQDIEGAASAPDDIDIKEMSRLLKVYRKLPDAQRNKLFQLAQTLVE